MKIKRNSNWTMRASLDEKANIARLANRLRVTEADAVRIAVSELLRSGRMPHVPFRLRRPVVIRRKVTE